MGGPNKLTAEIGGVALVRRVAEAAMTSRAEDVLVVTGHRAGEVGAALAGLDLRLVHNPDHAGGLSTSLRAGIAALDAEADGALVLLGDMPFVDAGTIDQIIAAFEASGGRAIVVPVHEGLRGNPVLWPRRFFPALMEIEGDKGARDVIAAHTRQVIEVVAGEGIARDLDTPEAMAAAGGRFGES